jgi:hypothetical protein
MRRFFRKSLGCRVVGHRLVFTEGYGRKDCRSMPVPEETGVGQGPGRRQLPIRRKRAVRMGLLSGVPSMRMALPFTSSGH